MGKKPRALMVASVASMIDQFNMQNIQILLDKGFDVDVACNCKTGNTISNDRVQDMIQRLAKQGVKVTHLPIPRKITDISNIRKSIVELKKMFAEHSYTLMHCHSPIGSVVARTAAKKYRKNGVKVIYTAHGFHFYKGAPIINWILFYPIERIYSRITDVLITINKEDFQFAKKHLKAREIRYVPGIGVDTKKFQNVVVDKEAKRSELEIKESDFMIISVGELNKNKNQEIIIRAIALLKKNNIHYFVAGQGSEKEHLMRIAKELNVNLHLLGYRTDIAELLKIADVYAFPSYREGLSVALMEAMASGLPCVVSKIRGNTDLIYPGENGYLCMADDVCAFANAIKKLYKDEILVKRMGDKNYLVMKDYDIGVVSNVMSCIYG